MSLTAILEVALGMIFAWLALSMAAMYIQEWIVSKLGWRANMLELFIANLLGDPALAKQFYDHPLIQGLHSGSKGHHKPAYIPSDQFSMAILDIISNLPKEASLIQKPLYNLQSDIRVLGKSKRKLANQQIKLILGLARKTIASVGGDAVVNGLMEEVKKAIRKLHDDNPTIRRIVRSRIKDFVAEKSQVDAILAGLCSKNKGSDDQSPFGQFKIGLAAMSVTEPELKQAIDAMINGSLDASVEGDAALGIIRKSLDDWFNSAMDRLSGWYKRRAQILAFVIGVILGIGFNIDSMQLATQLWRDPTIREALAAQASAFSNQDPNSINTPNSQQILDIGNQVSELNIPIGWIGTAISLSSTGTVPIDESTEKLCTAMPKSDIDMFGFSIAGQCYPIINAPWFNDPTGWLLKLIGIFITATAVAQGAPFWFDILKKIVNVRGSGVNTDTVAQVNAR